MRTLDERPVGPVQYGADLEQIRDWAADHTTIGLVFNSGPRARKSWRRRVHPPTIFT